jgi:hypothetical protein
MKTCTILIRDEVNCKLVGLDLPLRQKLVKRFKFEVPYAKHLPAVKLGRWDGKVAFLQLGGSTYINLLDEIIPLLIAEGYDIQVSDHREYTTSFEFPLVDLHTLGHISWPAGHQLEGQPIGLREHQVDAINSFLSNPQCLQEISTSAGKTIITATLSMFVETYGRSIVIVPNRSLVNQTYEDYANLGLDVGVFYGKSKEWTRKHTICTWQSLNSLFKKTKDGTAEFTFEELIEDVVCVIVDECFAGDTLILTPNGKVQIKNLKPGDKVINLDEKSNQYKEDTIVKVHENLCNINSEDMLELMFDNGNVIKVTANHKLLTNCGWVRADEITDEMEIININSYG